MSIDYHALLSGATAGRSSADRMRIYAEARDVIARRSVGTDAARQEARAHALALEDAIRRIESDIAAQLTAQIAAQSAPQVAAQSAQLDDDAPINPVLADGGRGKRFALIAALAVAVIGLAGYLIWYMSTRSPRPTQSASTSSSTARASDDAIATDLKPGVDGGSSGAELPFPLRRQVVFYRTTIVPGSIVVDPDSRFLYLIQSDNSARRYGIGIAQGCQKPGSLFRVANKMEWPEWRPLLGETGKDIALTMPGGPGNPLGARALMLDRPGLAIHGTNSPATIGRLVSSGCIRLVNEDVEDLYRRVSVDTRVIFRN